jgi:hypothetical protein
MSMVPQMRSSVAPSGSSTSGVRIVVAGSFSPRRARARASGPIILVSVGLELKASSTTTSIMGSRSTSDRTATDLPVPRSPMIRTPPMLESTTLSSSASFMSSWPAMRTKGKAGFFLDLSETTIGAAAAAHRGGALLRAGRAPRRDCGPEAVLLLGRAPAKPSRLVWGATRPASGWPRWPHAGACNSMLPAIDCEHQQ